MRMTRTDKAHRRARLENFSSTLRVTSDLDEMIEGISSQEIANMMERCFRRGYTQGAGAAMEAAKAGHDPEEIRQWFVRLLRWRGTNHKGEPSIAPQMETARRVRSVAPRKPR